MSEIRREMHTLKGVDMAQGESKTVATRVQNGKLVGEPVWLDRQGQPMVVAEAIVAQVKQAIYYQSKESENAGEELNSAEAQSVVDDHCPHCGWNLSAPRELVCAHCGKHPMVSGSASALDVPPPVERLAEPIDVEVGGKIRTITHASVEVKQTPFGPRRILRVPSRANREPGLALGREVDRVLRRPDGTTQTIVGIEQGALEKAMKELLPTPPKQTFQSQKREFANLPPQAEWLIDQAIARRKTFQLDGELLHFPAKEDRVHFQLGPLAPDSALCGGEFNAKTTTEGKDCTCPGCLLIAARNGQLTSVQLEVNGKVVGPEGEPPWQRGETTPLALMPIATGPLDMLQIDGADIFRFAVATCDTCEGEGYVISGMPPNALQNPCHCAFERWEVANMPRIFEAMARTGSQYVPQTELARQIVRRFARAELDRRKAEKRAERKKAKKARKKERLH